MLRVALLAYDRRRIALEPGVLPRDADDWVSLYRENHRLHDASADAMRALHQALSAGTRYRSIRAAADDLGVHSATMDRVVQALVLVGALSVERDGDRSVLRPVWHR